MTDAHELKSVRDSARSSLARQLVEPQIETPSLYVERREAQSQMNKSMVTAFEKQAGCAMISVLDEYKTQKAL